MTEICLAITRVDGSVRIRSARLKDKHKDETREEFVQRVYNDHPVVGMTSVEEVLRSDIPHNDRAYRKALTRQNGAFTHDMQKARSVHRENIREQRKSMLADLDVEMLRAVGSNDTVKIAQVETEKQRLRDATTDPRIDAAGSIAVLKLVDPLAKP